MEFSLIFEGEELNKPIWKCARKNKFSQIAKTSHLKNKSTGNSAQCYAAAWVGEGFRGERLSLCCAPETTSSVLFSRSVVSDSLTPWTAARRASLSITNSRSPPKPMSIESVMPSNHLILCRPLLLLPSVFPSIRVSLNQLYSNIK